MAAILLATLLLPSCASRSGASDGLRSHPGASSGDFTQPYRRTGEAPRGSLWIRTIDDRRPGQELGSTNYLNASYQSNQLFDRPLGSLLGDAILAAAADSNVFTEAGGPEDAEYLLSIEILHLYTKLDRNLLSLIPILPNIDVEARMVLRLSLTDQDGRPFLTDTYEERLTTWAAAIGVDRELSRDLLRATLRRILQRWLPAADQAIPMFWKRLGLPMPSERS